MISTRVAVSADFRTVTGGDLVQSKNWVNSVSGFEGNSSKALRLNLWSSPDRRTWAAEIAKARINRQKLPQSARSKCVLIVGKRQDLPLFLSQCALLPEEFLKNGFAVFLHDATHHGALMIQPDV